MVKKKQAASITNAEITEWYTAGDAAKVLAKNSGRPVRPDYPTKLGQLEKVRIKKLNARTTLYSKEDIDNYVVETRGVKSGAAKRVGKTGPTVREARKKTATTDAA